MGCPEHEGVSVPSFLLPGKATALLWKHFCALESLLKGLSSPPTWHKHQLFVWRSLSLMEHSSPHALCHPDRADYPGMQFLSGARCMDPRYDCTRRVLICSHICTLREDTPQNELSTLLSNTAWTFMGYHLSRDWAQKVTEPGESMGNNEIAHRSILGTEGKGGNGRIKSHCMP